MKVGWRLAKLIGAVGAVSNIEWGMVPSVQPVLSVGDARGLTSPLRGPRVNSGGLTINGAGEHSVLKVQGVAAGGCWIRQASMSAQDASTIAWSVFDNSSEPFPSMTTAALAPRQMQEASTGTARARIFQGSGLTAELPPNSPIYRIPINENLRLESPPWDLDIPNGWWFCMWNPTAAILGFVATVVEDILIERAAGEERNN